MRPPRPSSTCCGAGRADPARGVGRRARRPGARWRRAGGWASGCAGTRIATLGRPARTSGEIAAVDQRQDQGQRAGPERLGQPQGVAVEPGDGGGGGEVGQVQDQRVEGRAVLGGEDAGDGAVVGRVGAEAVDGFGREGDEAAGRAGRRRRGRCRRGPGAAGRSSAGTARTDPEAGRCRAGGDRATAAASTHALGRGGQPCSQPPNGGRAPLPRQRERRIALISGCSAFGGVDPRSPHEQVRKPRGCARSGPARPGGVD